MGVGQEGGGGTTPIGVEGEEQSLMTCESIGSNLTYLKLEFRREGTKKQFEEIMGT